MLLCVLDHTGISGHFRVFQGIGRDRGHQPVSLHAKQQEPVAKLGQVIEELSRSREIGLTGRGLGWGQGLLAGLLA